MATVLKKLVIQKDFYIKYIENKKQQIEKAEKTEKALDELRKTALSIVI